MAFFGKSTQIKQLENEITRLRLRKSVLKLKLKRVQEHLKRSSNTTTTKDNYNKCKKKQVDVNDFNSKVVYNLILSLESQISVQSSLNLKLTKVIKDILKKLSYLTDLVKVNESNLNLSKIQSVTERLQNNFLENHIHTLETLFSNINEVVDRTNLLTLSGGIEAAKLSEDGKGMIVVIDELKNVSTFIKTTIHGNETMLYNLNELQNSNQLVKTEIIELINTFTNFESWNQIETTTDQLVVLANQIADLIELNEHESFIKKYEQDHLDFRLKIYKTLMGIAHYTREEMDNAHECVLGKWYLLGEGVDMITKHPTLENLEKPHREFHRAGFKALDYFYAGEHDFSLIELTLMEKANKNIESVFNSIRPNII